MKNQNNKPNIDLTSDKEQPISEMTDRITFGKFGGTNDLEASISQNDKHLKVSDYSFEKLYSEIKEVWYLDSDD